MREQAARTFLGLSVLVFSMAATVSAQPAKFEDVVRNLKNPDHKVRISAVRLLREAGYTEAIVPMAPLVNDPVNAIQLEAIDSELAFYLVEPIQSKKRVALIVEVPTDGRAPAAFDAGPLAVWPKAAPQELIDALLTAVDDDNKTVRVEAIYTLGVVAGAAGATLSDPAAGRLVKALEHPDPAVRAGAARVVGRLKVKSATDGLLKAVNDSSSTVRFAAIRALGEIRDERAIQAITDQLKYYEKGEGAIASMEALARIAHSSSAPVFAARIEDRDPKIRRAAVEGLARTGGGTDLAEKLVYGANQDESSSVRAAMTWALHRQGYSNYLGRMVDLMYYPEPARQIQGYLMEMGGSIVPGVLPRLQDPDPGVRERLATVLGAIGDQSTAAALTPLKQDSTPEVASAATHAIERIKMAQK